MEITIKTKFNPGDRCFGFYNGRLWNFRVDGISIKHEEGSYTSTEVYYRCTAVPSKDEKCEYTFIEHLDEHSAYTKEEILTLLEAIKNWED